MPNTQRLHDIALAYMVLIEGQELAHEQRELLFSSKDDELVMAGQIAAAARLSEQDKDALEIFQKNISELNQRRKEDKFRTKVETTIDAINNGSISI
jgi:hypothetical protein